jgi:hypothetical protein
LSATKREQAGAVAGHPPVPADGMLHPVPLLGMFLVAVNDHWLKAAFAAWWTGKLSDVAGMLFFPSLLQALVEVVLARAGRAWGPSRRVLVLACFASAVGLAAINLSPAAASAWSHALGALQWPLLAAWAVATGADAPALGVVRAVSDWTDVLAVPAVLASAWAGWRRCAASAIDG